MKIVAVGGVRLIGTKLMTRLSHKGHEVVAVSPGSDLAEAISGAHVVVDLANAPLLEDATLSDFFETSNRNLLAAETSAGVEHHVTLSVVGIERLLDSNCFRGVMALERLIKASLVPYTIVQSTQIFECLSYVAESATVGRQVRLSPALVQPIAADDVADAMADVAVAAPINGTIEVAGPERLRLSELVASFLAAKHDPREVVMDVHAPYFGVELDDRSLVPGDDVRMGPTRFGDWFMSLPNEEERKS